MAKLQSLFAMCVLYTISVVSCEEFCSVNTFNTSDNYMQFSKEANFEEYVVSGKFKDLHCCAKGYRSIIWLKDGKPYPWGLQESSFILFPESANQTIYAKGAKPEDAGNYTCVLKNETVVHKHTIQLTVFEKVPDDAKLTYISRNADVGIGDSLRLFCEAFIGQFDLPDARSEAYWLKVTPNNTFDQLLPHVHEEKIKREDNQTFGVYLVVPNVKKEDFGDYVCIISKPGNVKEHYVSVGERGERQFEEANKEAPFGIVILIVSVVFFLIVAVVVLFLKFGLQFLVYLKDSWLPSERLEENDKTFDALVLYGDQDSELALGVLRPTLENYKYSCLAKPLPETLGTWYSSLRNDSQNCHRIIAVLSPSVLNGTWESNGILQAISQLQCLGPKLICVILKELPKNQNDIKNAQGETLSKVANSVPILEWKRKSDEKFWYALRWRLPPKRDEEDARLNNMA